MVGFIDRNRPDHLAIQARDALVSLWVSLDALAEEIGVNAAAAKTIEGAKRAVGKRELRERGSWAGLEPVRQ